MENKSCKLELKQLTEEGTFSGYGSVFGVEDSYSDIVEKGAFQRSLASRPSLPKMLWQHRQDEPIGVYTKMQEDDYGLYVEGKLLLEVDRGREAHALLTAKAIDGLSIGYSVKDYEIRGATRDDYGTRHLKDVELYEVSLVTFPANEISLVGNVKNTVQSGNMPTVREFERLLTREAGFSRSQAIDIINGGYKSMLGTRDAGEVGDLGESLKGLLSKFN